MVKYTEDELKKKTGPELVELAKENNITLEKGSTKRVVMDLLLEVEDDEELEAELDEEELDEELLDDEADLEEDDIEEPAPTKKAAAKKPAAAKKAAASTDESTLAAKQVASVLGTEAKTLRQFFRSPASTVEAVGSGGRYEFLETDLPKIKSEFEAWRAAHAARGSKRGPGKKGSTPSNVEEIEDLGDIEELEELEDEIDEDDLELEDELTD